MGLPLFRPRAWAVPGSPEVMVTVAAMMNSHAAIRIGSLIRLAVWCWVVIVSSFLDVCLYFGVGFFCSLYYVRLVLDGENQDRSPRTTALSVLSGTRVLCGFHADPRGCVVPEGDGEGALGLVGNWPGWGCSGLIFFCVSWGWKQKLLALMLGFLRCFASSVIASLGGFEGWSGWDLLVPTTPALRGHVDVI